MLGLPELDFERVRVAVLVFVGLEATLPDELREGDMLLLALTLLDWVMLMDCEGDCVGVGEREGEVV